jgi:predicted anti-sigma-YlaC factor YlaD
MTDRLCTYPGRREDAIVEYLYGEIDSSHRVIFETHLSRCASCREQVETLGEVRYRLEQWAPPEPILALDHPAASVARANPAGTWSGWRDAPLWMQAAAAVLCIGIGAGAANVQVSY